MSDNEDLLGDDLGDQSLADYNLGNEEEDQLLADDYEISASQNVPSSVSTYRETVEPPPQYSEPEVTYNNQRIQYHLQPDKGESVVPNITVEVPNIPERPSYAPYEPPAYQEQALPPVMPAAPIESPQMVPAELPALEQVRERFTSERPVGAQRLPQQRDIPDSLDKVVVPRGGWGGGRVWRNPHFQPRYNNQYRRHYTHRGNFNQRPSFPPPQKIRASPPRIRPEIRPSIPQIRIELQPDLPPNIRPDIPPNIRPDLPPNRPDLPPNLRPDLPPNVLPELPPNVRPELPLNVHPDLPPNMRPELTPNMRPDIPPNARPELPNRPDLPPGHSDLPEMRPEPGMPGPDLPIRPEFPPHLRPDMPPELIPNIPVEHPFRPMERPPFRFPNEFKNEPRGFNPGVRPNFDPFYRPFRPFPPMREVAPNINQVPQVTIRHPLPPGGMIPQQEVRMLPVQLPVPPAALAGKKVLINPHFKGNFQPPVEGLTLPAYIPTRIQKSPPLSPTLENKFGPVKDIDDAAERFIAEQRNALARAATRKFQPRRSPQRYIENTTIEIENELARPARRKSDDDLLRRQEEFINANRAGLRRRMRSPTPPRRSPSPRRSPERVRARPDRPDRPDPARTPDEDSDYRRRMREQEALRERVMRAKEVRRRKNAAAAHAAKQDRERERLEREKEKEIKEPVREQPKQPEPVEQETPDTTRKSPDKEPEMVKDRSPIRKDEAEVNSTCEGLTPPRTVSPAALTPPLPRTEDTEEKKTDSDDDLDLILGDIDGILSDDDDTGRFKDKASKKPDPPKPTVDLRTKLPPKPVEKKPPRKPIVFEEREEKRMREKEKSPPRRAIAKEEVKRPVVKAKEKVETQPVKETKASFRQRITFDKRESQKETQSPPKEKEKDTSKPQFSNRRVILQRKITQSNEKSVFTRIEVKSDPSKPNPGIFSRAVRTAIGSDKSRIVINKKNDDPQIEYESDSDVDEDKLLEEETGNMAVVTNLPHGMTDTRLKTLAGNDVQNLNLDKEERSAKITFKTTSAAENFKKKFNNKMVAASRLTVTLR